MDSHKACEASGGPLFIAQSERYTHLRHPDLRKEAHVIDNRSSASSVLILSFSPSLRELRNFQR